MHNGLKVSATGAWVLHLASPTWAGQSAEQAREQVVDQIMLDYEQAAVEEVRSFCAAEWKDDFVMQKHCIDEQITARAKARAFDALKSTTKATIWGNCVAEWTTPANGVDWVMAYHCIDEQWVAYQALSRSPSRKMGKHD